MNNPEVDTNVGLTPRLIPPISYTIQNILISIGNVIAASISLCLTVFIVLPLSIVRGLVYAQATDARKPRTHQTSDSMESPKNIKNKVILIVGASRGIGLSVLRQYINDPNAVIIAVSSSIDSVRSIAIGLGKTPATIQYGELDLRGSQEQIAKSVRSLDQQYGPITHLYEVSGVTNYLQEGRPWGFDTTMEMINVNVSGTIASVLAMYDLMKSRRSGKICIVGSIAGVFGPANQISYSATKAFIDTFSTSLRVLAAPCGIEVVSVQPGFIDTRITRSMRAQGSTAPDAEFGDSERLAQEMKKAVEEGGVGVVAWPVHQTLVLYACRATNPICEEFGKWASMKSGVAGKKIS